MKDKILLVVAGGFGRVVAEHVTRDVTCGFIDDACKDKIEYRKVTDYVCENGIENTRHTDDMREVGTDFCGFVDDAYEIGMEICGVKVVGHVADLDKLFSEYKQLVVSIGDNRVRERIYRRARKIGYRFPNVICGSAYVSPYARIGCGCVFLNNVVVQNGSSVGDGVILNPGVEIHHDSMVEDYALIYTNSVVRTLARVGTRAKIGSTCSISNRAIVEGDAIVENGSIVIE